jgi:methanogenic corrinoid protein MtbC1
VYTKREVELIREVVERTKRGVAASLAIDDVRRTLSMAPGLPTQRPAELAARFVEAVQALDGDSAAETLRQAWELLDWDTLATELIVPAMREIGDRWHAGQLSVAAEHMASAQIRAQVLSLIRLLGERPGGPLAICACAPDEQHDLGLLLLTAELRRRGWGVLYLGASVPLDALAGTVAAKRPHALFLSATTGESAEKLRTLAESLSEAAGGITIVLGGQAAGSAAPDDLAALLDRLETKWRSARLSSLPGTGVD